MIALTFALIVSGLVILWRHRQRIRRVFARGRRPIRSEDALVTSFVVYLACLVGISLSFGSLVGHSDGRLYVGMAAASPLVAFSACLLAIRRFGGPNMIQRIIGRLGGRSWMRDTWVGCKSFAAVLPLTLIAALVATPLNSLLGLPQIRFDPFAAIIRQGGGVAAILVMVVIVIAPVVEEIAFRGMLFRGLRGRVGFSWAASLSALVFASAHVFKQPQALLQLIVLGVVLAYLRETSRSIVPCVVCHSLNNIFWVVIALWA